MTFEEYKNKALGKDGSLHYVYWVTDKRDGTHYIGKHKFNGRGDIFSDFFDYGTSSVKRSLVKKYRGERFEVTILKTFDNNAECSIYEAYLHTKFKVSTNPLFWNLVEVGIPTGLKFGYNDRKVHVIEKNTGKKISISSKEFRENRYKYESVNSGRITCISLETGEAVNITTDEFHKNRQKYKTYSEGKINAYDKVVGRNRQCEQQEIDAEPDRYERMEHDGRNKIVVVDGEGNTTRINKEFYHENKDKYKTPSTGWTTAIILSTGEKVRMEKDKFAELKALGEAVGASHFSKMDKVLDLEECVIKQVSKKERASNPQRYKYINSKEAKDFLGRSHKKPKKIYAVYDKELKEFTKIPKEDYYLNKDKYFISTELKYREILKLRRHLNESK